MIVAPERETPGISAMACANPSSTPSGTFSWCSSMRCLPTSSARPSSRPNTTSVVAMSHRLRAAVWICDSKTYPSRPIGIVPMITSQASR